MIQPSFHEGVSGTESLTAHLVSEGPFGGVRSWNLASWNALGMPGKGWWFSLSRGRVCSLPPLRACTPHHR